jgi:hypothetical protein
MKIIIAKYSRILKSKISEEAAVPFFPAAASSNF